MKNYETCAIRIISLSKDIVTSSTFTPGENETPLQPIGMKSGKENELGTF